MPSLKTLIGAALLLVCSAHSAEVPGPAGARAENKAQKSINELRGRWSSVPFTPFSQIGRDYAEVVLSTSEFSDENCALTESQKKALARQARYFLAALRAPTFDRFLAAIRGDLQSTPTVRNLPSLRAALEQRNLILPSDNLSEEDALRVSWSTHTDFGRGDVYYDAISLPNCKYEARLVRSREDLEKSPQAASLGHREHLGVKTRRDTTFNYGEAAGEAMSRDGLLLTAVVTLHMRTAPNKYGYPILVRYFWHTREARWVAMGVAELWSAKKRFYPIY